MMVPSSELFSQRRLEMFTVLSQILNLFPLGIYLKYNICTSFLALDTRGELIYFFVLDNFNSQF